MAILFQYVKDFVNFIVALLIPVVETFATNVSSKRGVMLMILVTAAVTMQFIIG